MTDKTRTASGKFKKGVSGNPSGRPKAVKVTAAFQKKISGAKNIHEMVDIIAKWLLESVKTKDEALKAFKELAPYYKPKLSSIKSDINVEKEVTIKIAGVNDLVMKNIKNKAKKDTIEGEVMKEIEDKVE